MIRTVLGDVENISRNVMMHEHIQCVSNDMRYVFGKYWLDEKAIEDYGVFLLKELHKRYSVDVFVDGTPWDLGRDAMLLKRISERSEVHIVASSGFFHFNSLMTCDRTADELCRLVVKDCKEGINGTKIKPGILKCAIESNVLKNTDIKRLSAVAIAQKETGLPLYIHSIHQDNLDSDIIDLLQANGADLKKCILGHAALRPDAEYFEGILSTGINICIDQCFPGREIPNAISTAELCRKGFENQILCSMDCIMYSDFGNMEGKGLFQNKEARIKDFGFLFDTVLPEFEKAGCTKEQCEKFVHGNSLKILDI